MSTKKKNKSPKKEKFDYRKSLVHYSYCLSIIILLLIAGLNLNNYLNNQKVLGTSIDVSPLQNEKSYWENIVTKYPTYIDGYLELSKIEVELGNKENAVENIKKALLLDPNSNKISEVELKLGL